LIVSDEALEKSLEEGVGFVDWKAGEPITDMQFQDWEVKANMVLSCQSDIKQLILYKEKPKACHWRWA